MDMSRVENILRYILGEEATLPVPLSRVEELLIELGRMIEEGKLVNPIVIKGRVDTLEDLYAVQNPEPGWLYFVGLETDTNLDEYVYSVENTWDRVGTSTIAVDSALSTESENPVQNKVITTALNGKAASTDIKDGILTISMNGSTVATFSANSASDVTVNLGNVQALIDAQHMLDADLVDDTNSTNKFTTAADITKLSGIETGAEVNQNAFSNVAVGAVTIEADAKTDTLTIAAGSNVTITPDSTNDSITIAATDTTYLVATPSTAGVGGTDGLLSAIDKEKLDVTFVYKGSVDNVDALPLSSNVTGDVKNVTYRYDVTTQEPSDWSTNYTSYYTKSGSEYTAVTGESAPTWTASTYYKRSNDGSNYVWISSSTSGTLSDWDCFSGSVQIDSITNAEIDLMFV